LKLTVVGAIDGAQYNIRSLYGLSRLIPELDRPAPPPPVLISRLRIAGRSYKISELGESEVRGIEVGPSRNHVQIEFFGLSFQVGDVLRYQYRLGSESEWVTVADSRMVNYASLRPGTYRFEVRAVNSDTTL
jgi:hypothetical protein